MGTQVPPSIQAVRTSPRSCEEDCLVHSEVLSYVTLWLFFSQSTVLKSAFSKLHQA